MAIIGECKFPAGGCLMDLQKDKREVKVGNDSPFQSSYEFVSSGEKSDHRKWRGKSRQERMEQGSRSGQ